MGKRRIKKTNPTLLKLVERLRRESFENKAPVWRDIADRLLKPRSQWAEVNVSKIERFASENDVSVAAFNCSDTAKDKIASAGGKSMSIEELLESNPKGSHVRIMR
jgi:large subunit ribosomal protein L18e